MASIGDTMKALSLLASLSLCVWSLVLSPAGAAALDVAAFAPDDDGAWTCGDARFANIAPLAGVRAKQEYHSFGGGVFRAIDVARGAGAWKSAGVGPAGRILEPEISDKNAQWLVLAWDEPQAIAALFLVDNFADLRFDVFEGPSGVTPLAGVGDEWKRVPDAAFETLRPAPAAGGGRWVVFDPPLSTRGLRLRVLRALTPQGGASQVAELSTLRVFSPLAPGELPATAEPPPPPAFAIPVELPADGLLTVVVDDAQGRRVRNLVAREPRAAGRTDVPWDLSDELGRPVSAGDYAWKAITGPEPELSYEFTVYPNVSQLHPGNSAWLNGPGGPGGWLADHTPPCGACAAGDFVFFGAPVPESGVGFAACDLTGRKLWGIHSFAAWSAGRHMATDGRNVFVEHAGSGHYGAQDEGADRIWSVDIATREWKSLVLAQESATRRRGARGLAARDGVVALSVDAGPSLLAGACGWESVDIAHCDPTYREPRKPRVPYEIVPDPRGDFLRLLRLKGDPPGYGHPGGAGLVQLASTRGPESRQHLLVAFHQPVPIGSVVLPMPLGADYTVRLSVSKPDAPFPPDPGDRSQWIDLEPSAGTAWDVFPAPPGTFARALLLTFSTGEDDEIGDLFDDVESGPTWFGEVEGLRLLRRRFANLAASATVRVNSGAPADDGTWTAGRDTPLSPEDPAIYAMLWDEPKTFCGLAVKEVDGERTEVDVFTGEDAPDPFGDAGWTQVAAFTSRRRMDHSGFEGHNALARYLDEMVDFGSNVVSRAVRLRVVSQFAADTREGSCAKDRLGLDATRCRIFGVAPLAPLGGEPPVDPAVSARIEWYDGATGELLRELPVPSPRELAYAPDGSLYAVTEGRVARIAPDADAALPLDIDVLHPGPLACDAAGNLYVFDAAPARRVVRVFSPSGAFLRDVGEPGGYEVGPWNPRRLGDLAAIAVDSEGKLWCVDADYWPKRVSCWSASGDFLHEVLGPTAYGGGGVLDPGDRSRLFYGPLEFELDWAGGTSRLKNLTWPPGDGWRAGEVPVRTNGLCYLVTRAEFTSQRSAIVYLYEENRLRRVAALGAADAFAPLRDPAIHALVDFQPLQSFRFAWTDRDGDGTPSPGEVRFTPLAGRSASLSDFARDLSICGGGLRFSVAEFLPGGEPVYREDPLPAPLADTRGNSAVYRLDDGSYYRFGDGADAPDAVFAPDGALRWSYPNEGAGVGPDRHCGPYSPGQVVCQFGVAGHETADAGDLGEFFVVHSNFGVWNLWTADGLLAGSLFRDLRDGRRVAWSMADHERGMRLDDVTAGQEHFQAYFAKDSASGAFYAVAGHNHASVVRVEGLDRFRRLDGTLRVGDADLAASLAWRRDMARYRARGTPRVLDAFDSSSHGASPDWRLLPSVSLPFDPACPDRDVSFQLAHDGRNLYARYRVLRAGPFRNAGSEWNRLFKTGAAVDLSLGLDGGADPARRAPVEGDMRILAAFDAGGTPNVVVYDAVRPDAPEEERMDVVSPVASVSFDSVRRLEGASFTHAPLSGNPANPAGPAIGYEVELRVPLEAIGLDPKTARRIRLDWGILETDSTAASVLRRSCWANPATSTIADAPSEARLEPDLWGWALFPGKDKETATLGDPASLLADDAAADLLDDFELDDF
jgi:hypothetical protein